MSSLFIDAHQHFWDLSRPFDYRWLDAPEHEPIRRDFLPAELQPHLETTGVDRTVFVQTQHNLEENRWALQLADEHEFIAGVVGWVDLAAESCDDQLAEFLDHPKFVGVRHITQDEPDDDFIIRPEVLRGLKVLQRRRVPFDLLFHPRHLRHAATLAQRLPELPLVIDHLAKPQIKDGEIGDWAETLCAAAGFPNVFCKLSGMITEANWTDWKASDLKPYVETALEAFGPERCLFGSDWPVCELAGSYEQVVEALDHNLGALSDDERSHIFGETARRLYALPV